MVSDLWYVVLLGSTFEQLLNKQINKIIQSNYKCTISGDKFIINDLLWFNIQKLSITEVYFIKSNKYMTILVLNLIW